MKETLYTIPLSEAFEEHDECPFCFIERKLEQDSIEFILGAAYMESDIRSETNKHGFCRHHHKMMFDYGNSLGNAIMLHSYFKILNQDLTKKMQKTTPGKNSVLSKFKKTKTEPEAKNTSLSSFIRKKEQDCFVCNRLKKTYERYLDTFFFLLKSDSDFYKTIKESKGFCLHHFADLMNMAEHKLNSTQLAQFQETVFPLMLENLNRVEEELAWFIEKFDYRNRDADWKNSKDAVPRGIQKITGGYPADPVFKKNT